MGTIRSFLPLPCRTISVLLGVQVVDQQVDHLQAANARRVERLQDGAVAQPDGVGHTDDRGALPAVAPPPDLPSPARRSASAQTPRRRSSGGHELALRRRRVEDLRRAHEAHVERRPLVERHHHRLQRPKEPVRPPHHHQVEAATACVGEQGLCGASDYAESSPWGRWVAPTQR